MRYNKQMKLQQEKLKERQKNRSVDDLKRSKGVSFGRQVKKWLICRLNSIEQRSFQWNFKGKQPQGVRCNVLSQTNKNRLKKAVLW